MILNQARFKYVHLTIWSFEWISLVQSSKNITSILYHDFGRIMIFNNMLFGINLVHIDKPRPATILYLPANLWNVTKVSSTDKIFQCLSFYFTLDFKSNSISHLFQRIFEISLINDEKRVKSLMISQRKRDIWPPSKHQLLYRYLFTVVGIIGTIC